MPDPAIEALRERVRALKKHAPVTGYDSAIWREGPRAKFKGCVDHYFEHARNPIRNVVGESRELTNLDESMRHLLALAQTRSLISAYQAEFRVLERLIDAVELASTRPTDDAGDEPKTAFAWISRVEHRLRELIVSKARDNKGAQWPEHVEELLGKAASAARATMQQRGVAAPEELIHYTQLQDVVRVISENFSLYAPALGMNRRQFNSYAADILKGRTEGAHSRPEHLWPELEQSRVKLACHDLLDAIRRAAVQGQRS